MSGPGEPRVPVCFPCSALIPESHPPRNPCRNLTSGEYIQMSGRAGRRGKDVRGHVVLLVDKGFTEEVARKVMLVRTSVQVS